MLLCSDYIWCLEDNLELARRARAINPQLLVIHGGPSAPKYAGDAEAFLRTNRSVAHLLVHGEGEVSLCQLLTAIAPDLPGFDPEAVAPITGVAYLDPESNELVQRDPERIADLADLPSPYLTGEFAHIRPEAWRHGGFFETARGCPYGCTFCDWGSLTSSRIRRFDLDRVTAEFEWAAEHGLSVVYLCDPNFGISSRDAEVAERLSEIRRRTGNPPGVAITPAKNTIKHLTRIFDSWLDAGLHVLCGISLQTTDSGSLEAIARSNISTPSYLALAAALRRRGQNVRGDVLMGLPAQTYDTYRADIQFFFDHEIRGRTWLVRLLPNAPMNDPDYRERWGIEVDDQRRVAATTSMSAADIERALRFRNLEITCEQLGVLRHVLRYLQWDHGHAATDVLEHLLVVAKETPLRFPHITWLVEYFDLHPTVSLGWAALYREVHRLIIEDLGVARDDAGLRTVLQLQQLLMPASGRTFPAFSMLAHDYVAYYRSATASLYTTGQAGHPDRPLVEYPPAPFTVDGDPMALCEVGIDMPGDSRDTYLEGEFHLGEISGNELDSPLVRIIPVMGMPHAGFDPMAITARILEDIPESPPPLDTIQHHDGRVRIPVELRTRAGRPG